MNKEQELISDAKFFEKLAEEFAIQISKDLEERITKEVERYLLEQERRRLIDEGSNEANANLDF